MVEEKIKKIIEEEIITVDRPKLRKGEKYRFISNGSINGKGHTVKVIGTNKRIFIRPIKNISLPENIKSKKDIELKDILRLKRETFEGIEIETKKEVYKISEISDQKNIANKIAEDAGLTKIDFGKKSLAKGVSKKVAGGVGVGLGLIFMIGGIILGVIFMILGAFLCLTIIGVIIGLPLIIVGGLMILGALGVGGGCISIGSLGFGGKEEWKRISKKKGDKNVK